MSRLFIGRPLRGGCSQKDSTLTLVHANTTGRACSRSLPAPQRGAILHNVPTSESGQGPGGLSSDLGSKSSKHTDHCLQALLRDQGSQSAQQAMQECYGGGAGTRDRQ